jgi:hypothetical protein
MEELFVYLAIGGVFLLIAGVGIARFFVISTDEYGNLIEIHHDLLFYTSYNDDPEHCAEGQDAYFRHLGNKHSADDASRFTVRVEKIEESDE